ncbi:hypothetical protein MNBD_ALPHA08-53 [hydrothermal vent metagenome]|uniref:Uncharacterized protein n=1 Tax=hydrothermal vent metagenome TaxID=652676 RepID=A0A3B0S105_9ZZZZ
MMKMKILLLTALLMVPLMIPGALYNSTIALAKSDIYLEWFKPANANLRLASSYLRTGNIDFAALALEKIVEGKTQTSAAGDLAEVITSARAQAKSALDLVDANEPEKARDGLLKLREMLFQQHKARKIEVFDDCIWELNKRGPALWRFRKNAPDLGDQQQSQAVGKAAAEYLEQLDKCDEMAAPETKSDGSFQRLVKGARTSLKRFPAEVLDAKDGGLLFRFIIELRSFDRLLYLRFG